MCKKADDEGEAVLFIIFIAIVAFLIWPFVWGVWGYRKAEKWLSS